MKKKNEYTHKLKSDFNVMLQTQCDLDFVVSLVSHVKKKKDTSTVMFRSSLELHFLSCDLGYINRQSIENATN